MVISQKLKSERKKRADEAAKLNTLPNSFKFAAEALKTMSERRGSARSIIVTKFKNYNYKHIFALVMNTVKNIKIIKKIIHETKLTKKVPTVNDPFLLEILVGDLLYGKGLKTLEQNLTASVILGLKDSIIKQQNLLKKDFASTSLDGTSAKYLRVNSLKSNMDSLITQLKTKGLVQLDYSKDKIKFKKFINKFKSMEDNQFMLDFHFPQDLVVLNSAGAEKLKGSDMIKGKAMFQDKASFMAVEALNVKPEHKVIDACCAPGCKTSLIANKMKNKGKILAYDLDKKRLSSAIHLLKVNGVTCAKLEVQDFSKLKMARLLKTNNIEFFDSIIIDPSCSGSGLAGRIDYDRTSREAGRLKKLQAFQVSLLKHALKSNVSKSIVYCTCSVSTEENEQVIEMALEESGVKSNWNVVEILPYWSQRGDDKYEFGPRCVRSDGDSLTNGFFIAKLVCLPSNATPKSVRSDDPELITDEKEVRPAKTKPVETKLKKVKAKLKAG